MAVSGEGGSATAGIEGSAIVHGNGNAEIVRFGVAACLHQGGTATGGHGVAAFVKDGGEARTGDGGTSLSLQGGRASVYHHGVAVAANNGEATAGGKGSIALLMNQGDQGFVRLGNAAEDSSLMIIRYHHPDDPEGKLRFKIGVIGSACDVVEIQEGLRNDTCYRLNDCLHFEEVDCPAGE